MPEYATEPVDPNEIVLFIPKSRATLLFEVRAMTPDEAFVSRLNAVEM